MDETIKEQIEMMNQKIKEFVSVYRSAAGKKEYLTMNFGFGTPLSIPLTVFARNRIFVIYGRCRGRRSIL